MSFGILNYMYDSALSGSLNLGMEYGYYADTITSLYRYKNNSIETLERKKEIQVVVEIDKDVLVNSVISGDGSTSGSPIRLAY